MVILLSGGGTGGHITPILAVAHELKKQAPDCVVVYVGEKGGKFAELTDDQTAIDHVYSIRTGKFRRYHKRGMSHTLTDWKTPLLNLRDAFYVLIGLFQAWLLLGRVKPDMVFLKGGFVGVPIGLAAAARKIPFVTHDSDIVPGLANRIVSRWARLHATALPAENYTYPTEKVREVGVLVESSFRLIPDTDEGKKDYKSQIDIPAGSSDVLLITGGSSGAARLNEAVIKIIPQLVEDYPALYVIHQVGKGKGDLYSGHDIKRLLVVEFMRPMYAFTGASDVVVARASANTVAELGVQAKATIVVPSPFLAGGHQLANAKRLKELGAVISVPETIDGTDVDALDKAIRLLLDDKPLRTKLASRLHEITKQNAATELAHILLAGGAE